MKVKYKDDDDVFNKTKYVNVYNTQFVFHDQKLMKLAFTFLKKSNPKYWTKWVNSAFRVLFGFDLIDKDIVELLLKYYESLDADRKKYFLTTFIKESYNPLLTSYQIFHTRFVEKTVDIMQICVGMKQLSYLTLDSMITMMYDKRV